LNFRARTTLTIGVLTAIALGGAFTAVAANFNKLQRDQLDASLLSVAREEAKEAKSLGFRFSGHPGPARNDVGPLTNYGIIYDGDGHVLAATPPFDRAPPTRDDVHHPLGKAFDIRFQGQPLRAILVPIPNEPNKVVFLATSRADLDGDEGFLSKAMLVAFAVSVAWASAVAYWAGGRLTHDHRAIAAVARSVAAGNLSARASVLSRDPEVAQLGRDINDMIGRLTELMESQRRFIAHAAHELRSPLTALYGELQQALRKERDAESYKELIGHALAATRRLKALAEDLLLLARAQSQKGGADTAVPLERALVEARTMVEGAARARNVAVELATLTAWHVRDRNGDVVRLFRNLLENAVQHSPDGGVVRVQGSAENGMVRVAVSDQGPGVPPSEHQAIFEPFFRGQRAPSRDGTGLGLGIAREIARNHGGDVVLADTEAGASFLVSLPVAPPREE
jgi:two-component system heavy metal sensor histidine kinase CusS